MKLKFLSVSAMALTLALSGPAFAATATPDLVPSGYTIASTDALASRVINAKVYSGPDADAAEIGYVKDLVLGASGQISAVVLGVGGFLGAGETNVVRATAQSTCLIEGLLMPSLVPRAVQPSTPKTARK